MMHTTNNKQKRKGPLLPACIWIILFFIVSAWPRFTDASEIEKKGINETFREITKTIEASYNTGDLKSVILIYEEKCSKGDKGKPHKEKKTFRKVNKEIRAEIYRWMFLTYSALDRQEKADIFLKKYLVIRHREGIGRAWLFLKNRASDLYIIMPRWRIGITGGFNYTFINPGERYKIMESINSDEPTLSSFDKEYTRNLIHCGGGQGGVVIEYGMTKKLSLCAQPTLNKQYFRYKNRYSWGDDNYGRTEEYTHFQVLTNIEIPLLLKYRIVNSKLKPYIQAGGFCGILTAAIKNLSYKRTRKIEGIEAQSTYGDGADIKNQLKHFYFGLWAGVGLGFHLGDIILVEIEGCCKYRFGNIVDEQNRYKNENLCFTHYDVFDDMRLINWELSLKLLLPLSFKAFRK